MTPRVLMLALALALALAGCSSRLGVREADWERGAIDTKPAPRETSITLPAFPQDGDLVEFFPGPLSSHRYFIDAKNFSVGADGVLRYTVVVKTTGGSANVVYEGIRCESREKRVYALGQAGQKWLEAKRSDWEPIDAGRRNEYQALLYTDYFCPGRTMARDRGTVLDALRSGLRGPGLNLQSD